MKGLAIDDLCLEFRIIDPTDGWLFRIRATNVPDHTPKRWKVEVCAAQTVDWLGLDEEVNEFDWFEEAYDCLDNYMQGRFLAQGHFD